MAPPSPVGPSPRHPDAGSAPKRRRRFPACDESVALARRHVRDVLAQWEAHPEVADDATLVVSELATNVIAHTDSPVLVLTLRLDATRLRIEVEDRSGGSGRPRPGRCEPDAENGRGLLIVANLAATWGVAVGPAAVGSLVWAELVWRRASVPDGNGHGHGRRERAERHEPVRPLPGAGEPVVPRHPGSGHSVPGHPVPGRPPRPVHSPHTHSSHSHSPHAHGAVTRPSEPGPVRDVRHLA